MKPNKIPLILLCVLLFACQKDQPNTEVENPVTIDITGVTEKGPYLSGSTITINELNANFAPSGRVFNTQIVSDDGLFELKGIELSSAFVGLTANGFYYNEVLDDNSDAQLTMHAISDISNQASININVITTLEKNRVEYLLSQGETFTDAKSKALNEILAIFEINNNSFIPENLSITEAGDENAKLLAVSVILQGLLSVADLSELMSKISLDLREDGVLDDIALGEQLVFNAHGLDLMNVRENLELRLENINDGNGVVPPFEKYVLGFIDNTSFEFRSRFEYPEDGKVDKNILHPNFTSTIKGKYSMAATIPEGSQLIVRLRGNNFVSPFFQATSGMDRTSWDRETYTAEYTSTRTGEVDFEIWLDDHDPDGPVHNKIKVEVFEDSLDEPTFTKEILITDIIPEIRYKEGLLYNHAPYFDVGRYNMGAFLGEGLSLKTKVTGEYWSLDESQSNTGWEFSPLDNSDNSRTFTSIENFDEIDIYLELLQPPGDTLWDIIENFDNEGNLTSVDSTVLDIDYRTPAAIIEIFENGSSTPTRTEEIIVGF